MQRVVVSSGWVSRRDLVPSYPRSCAAQTCKQVVITHFAPGCRRHLTWLKHTPRSFFFLSWPHTCADRRRCIYGLDVSSPAWCWYTQEGMDGTPWTVAVNDVVMFMWLDVPWRRVKRAEAMMGCFHTSECSSSNRPWRCFSPVAGIALIFVFV